jgi:hypothetical protein
MGYTITPAMMLKKKPLARNRISILLPVDIHFIDSNRSLCNWQQKNYGMTMCTDAKWSTLYELNNIEATLRTLPQRTNLFFG